MVANHVDEIKSKRPGDVVTYVTGVTRYGRYDVENARETVRRGKRSVINI